MLRKFIIVSLALLVFIGSAAAISSAQPASKGLSSNLPSATWNGSLVINPDGSLSNIGAPVVQNGNVYILTGNINGSLTVNYNGAVIQGNGHSVWNTIGFAPVTVSNAGGITVENLTAISWTAAPSFSISASSNDVLLNNTVIALATGIFDYSPYNQFSGNTVIMNQTTAYSAGYSIAFMIKGSSTTLTGNSVFMNQTGAGIVINTGTSNVTGNYVEMNAGGSTGITTTNSLNIVAGNTILVNGTDSNGISLQGGTISSTVVNNTVYASGSRAVGIIVADGLNTVSGNVIYGDGGFVTGIRDLASGTGHNILSWNEVNVTGQSSIGVYSNDQNSQIEYNMVTVNGTASRGISGQGILRILGNSVNVTGDNTYAITAPYGIISDNTILISGQYTYGVYAIGGESASIIGNVINSLGNNNYGIGIEGSFETVTGNTVFTGNDSGTAFFALTLISSVVADNNLSNSSTGIQSTSYSSAYDTFFGNSLYNDWTVFSVSGTSSILFYHNNFVNFSSLQVTGNGNATWDNGYPSGGNYWSSYSGPDLFSGPGQNISGSDGIIDQQYNITGSNIDYYPLVSPWSMPRAVFTQTGLPQGTDWTVTFNGQSMTSSSASISFDITDASYASYSYSVPSVAGYTNTPTSGNVDFTGTGTSTQIAFTAIPAPTYTVKFSQSGLPSGTGWEITMNGASGTSTGSTISFTVHNGTYSYSLDAVSGFSPNASGGNVTVSGQNADITISFTVVKYAVQFSTLGLPSGMTWYVNLSSGQSFSTSQSLMDFDLANGTYSYSVDNVSNYSADPATGTFVVSGHSPGNVQITFTTNESSQQIQPNNTTNGQSFWPYIIGGLIGAAIAGSIAFVVYYWRKK